MNLRTPPPGKRSDLIRLAVADARRLDPNDYTPQADVWHEPDPHTPHACMICLAGAVIAATLDCPRSTRIEIGRTPSTTPGTTTITDEPWQHALWALDNARKGDWTGALYTLGPIDEIKQLKDRLESIPGPEHPQFRNWAEFNAHLDSLADRAGQLRELGL